MNCPRIFARSDRIALADFSDAAQAEIARVFDIWSGCRDRYGDQGPWLFGSMCIADILYAPVAMRFITYDIPLPVQVKEYVASIAALPSMQEWRDLSAAEVEKLDFVDNLVPVSESPLTFG